MKDSSVIFFTLFFDKNSFMCIIKFDCWVIERKIGQKERNIFKYTWSVSNDTQK